MIARDNSSSAVQNELDAKPVEIPRNSAKRREVLDGFTSLYRYYDKGGNLLYVGISVSAISRLMKHRRGSQWFRKAATIAIEHFETRALALNAERLAIVNEGPKHNVTHRAYGKPGSRKFYRVISDAEFFREESQRAIELFDNAGRQLGESR